MTSYANTIYLQKGKQLMTMEEMARIIGVSRITLSKVMNDKEGVSEKTRERVKEYIKKYNFEPNSQARSLVGKKEPITVFLPPTPRNPAEVHILHPILLRNWLILWSMRRRNEIIRPWWI